MKLLLVQPLSYLFSAGGAHKANRLLFEALAARGHTCRAVISSLDRDPHTQVRILDDIVRHGARLISTHDGVVVYEHKGVEVHEITDIGVLGAAYVFDQIKRYNADWVLVSEDPTYMLLETAFEAAPSQIVILAHSQATVPFGPESYAIHPAKAHLFRRAAGIVACSRYVQRYLKEWGDVDSEVFRFPVYGSEPFPMLAHFERGAVLMVNPSAIKGIAIFLELAKQLPEVPFAAVPTWATQDEDRSALAQLPNVRVLEPFEQMNDLFAQTRILLVPSLWGEAFGQIVVEAMLRGIPVIASDVGGLPEAKLGIAYVLPVNPIKQYRTNTDDPGMQLFPVPIVPAQDVTQWRITVERLCTDRAHYHEIASASYVAARAFASTVTVTPFESYLRHLETPVASSAASEVTPDVRLTADALSVERRALLALRLRKSAANGAQYQAIPRLPRAGTVHQFPLSYAQQRLWFLDQLTPGSITYNTGSAYRLRGSLNEQALRQSLTALVQRHEILRTTFDSVEGQPVQYVHSYGEVPLTLIDLRDQTGLAREEALRHYTNTESSRPFDLARGPLLRVTLLRLQDEEHALVLAVHHIIVDGWSTGIIVRELSQLYNAFCTGRQPHVTELPIQYGDFASWQQHALHLSSMNQQLAYWKRQLADAPTVLDLPMTRRYSVAQAFSAGRYPIHLDAGTTTALQQLGQTQGTTLFMNLLAAFGVLLHRSSGQTDLIIGALSANRNRPELEHLIGFFVNTLALRLRFDTTCSFRDLLQQVRETTLAAYTHQDVAFERVLEALQSERSATPAPLVQVLFNLHDATGDDLRLHNITSQYLAYDKGLAGISLTLDLWSHEGCIDGVFEYNTGSFDPRLIESFAQAFQELLRQVTQHPDRALASVPLVSSPDLYASIGLHYSEDSANTFQPEQMLWERVAQQAKHMPDAPAIRYGTTQITYGTLERVSNQLAHFLKGAGAGVHSDRPVALMLAPGGEQIIALLSVMKTGVPFVVIDPDMPDERAVDILAHSAPAILLASSVYADQFRTCARQALLDVHNTVVVFEEVLARDPVSPPDATHCHASKLDDPIYIVYTSGSTGTPKGIVQGQRSFHQFVSWFATAFSLGPGKQVAQWATLTYDAAYTEIFAALWSGATLCMVDASTRYDPLQLVRWVHIHQIDLLQVVPSFCAQMLRTLDEEPVLVDAIAQLETLLLAGETLSVQLIRDWQSRFPSLPRVYNLYGPTETILATFYDVQAVYPGQRIVPVGRPIAGREILILDADNQPCPPGFEGEIVIRSQFLTLGYLHQPALTAERFKDDLFQQQRGSPVQSSVALSVDTPLRLYYTGDRGRWLADGTLEFRGRGDDQVKIRGVRVELAEVESALMRHPHVRATAVRVCEDHHGMSQLVAYVVTDRASEDASSPDGERLDQQSPITLASDLRSFMKTLVPDALIPSIFVELASLPLTHNGKIDRRALPDPAFAERMSEDVFVAPRTAIEEVLALQWSELLRLDRPSITENFFAVGGHSLLATQLVARIRQHFQLELPLRVVFEYPTIAGQAEQIGALQQASADAKRARVLDRIKHLSDEEVQLLLQQKGRGG